MEELVHGFAWLSSHTADLWAVHAIARWIPSGQVHWVNILDTEDNTCNQFLRNGCLLYLPNWLIVVVGRVGVEPTARSLRA
jgi:hypothetical protein